MKAVKRKDQTVVSDAETKHICVPCRKSFQYNCLLKYHIRQYHFERVGLAPYADTKNVNDVWVEKVENTEDLVQIKKVGTNKLLIQKVKDNTIQPTYIKRDVIDVRKKYPVRNDLVQCGVCRKSYDKKGLSNHFVAVHKEFVKKRCEACDTSFKRLYHRATHICPFIPIKKTKKDANDEWTITDSI